MLKASRSKAILGLVALSVAGAATLTLTSRTGSTSQVRLSSSTASADAEYLSIPLNLNRNDGPIAGMTGDSAGPGVWGWGNFRDGARVFHYDGDSHQIKNFPLSQEAREKLVTFGQGGLAVDKGGSVWVGAATSIARLDPTTGETRVIGISDIAASPAADAIRPARLRGQHEVHDLAVSPDGQELAIVVSDSSAIVLYHPSTDTFASIPLPDSTEGSGVAYADDGTLAIGSSGLAGTSASNEHFVQIRMLDGTIVTLNSDGGNILPIRDGFVTGFNEIETVSTAGVMTKSEIPRGAAAEMAFPTFVPRPNGGYIIPTRQGFVVTDAGGTVAQTLTLPTQSCPGETSEFDGTCATWPVRVLTDGAGNVWFTMASSSSVGLIAAT